MSLEIPNPKAMLEIVTLQEETLQFERFTMEETWELGLLIRRQVLNHGGNAAVEGRLFPHAVLALLISGNRAGMMNSRSAKGLLSSRFCNCLVS